MMDLVSNKRYYDETQKYGIINDNERIKLIRVVIITTLTVEKL